MIHIHAISVGQPQTLTDSRGSWRSAIARKPVSGPVELGARGLAGDRVADTKNHGSPDQAVCCHSLDHYEHWNTVLGLAGDARLGPGSIGENWTLTGATEADVCVGDIYTVGTARVQVTAPRYPCAKQERVTGLADFHNRAIESMRTGFYLRVLTPGMVEAGDTLNLEARPRPGVTLQRINELEFAAFDADAARALLDVPELAEGWKNIIRHRLSRHDQGQ